jgi:hypothetical protein
MAEFEATTRNEGRMSDGARLETLSGSRGVTLRRWRFLLLAAWLVLVAYLLGPFALWSLPGDPSLIPRPGQSRIHTILVAIGWAAAVNAGLLLLLLASSALWARDETAPLAQSATARVRIPGTAIALLLVACALAGALRWNLAHGGVWWDEAWSVRHAILGAHEPDPDEPGRLRFEPVPWTNTLFYYRKPTNHVLYSVTARASIGAWRVAAGAGPEAWDEFALRFPAFAAALLSVLLLGLLVHDLGFPRAAPGAAFLLAIHPWHVRFGADGRGYSFMVLFAIVAAWCLLHGLRDGRWRWWLGYGSAQLALLWTHPLSVYFPLALGAAGAVGLWLGPGSREDRLVRLARLLVVNALAAMAFLQVMAPNLAQAAALYEEWRKVEADPGTVGRRVWLYLATGLAQNYPRSPDETLPTLRSIWGGALWTRGIVFGLLPGLAALGFVRAGRQPGAARVVVIGLCAAVPIALLHRSVSEFLLIERFVIYGLVPVATLVAIGAETLVAAIVPRRFGRAAVPIGLAAALAAYQAFVLPQTRVLLDRPQMATREVAAFIAAAELASPNGVLRAGVGIGGQVPAIYDPYLEHVETREEIAELCARARVEGRPLYLAYGYYHANRTGRFRDLFADLDDPRYFELAARFPGIETEFTYRVLRYTGRALGE